MMSQSIACLNMVKQQLRTNNITDEKILKMFQDFPREDFLPQAYKKFAYADMHIPLSSQQVILTPLEEAKIIQSAQFNGSENILLIHSENIYLAVLLSQLTQNVTVLQKEANTLIESKKMIQKYQIDNVELILQDSINLSVLNKSFDAIILTTAIENIPNAWLEYLKPVAKIFASMGESVQHGQWIYVHDKKIIGHEFVFSTHLPFLQPSQSKFIF